MSTFPIPNAALDDRLGFVGHPGAIASDEVAAQAGYSAGSGGFNNLRSSLRTLGLIDYPGQGQVRANDWLFP